MTQPLLSLHHVGHQFGATTVLQDISLAVMPGEIMGLIGPNGAGKSTLFNLISGEFKPTYGHIELRGKPLNGLPPHTITRLGVGRSFQISRVFGSLTVAESLTAACLWRGGFGYGFWSPIRRRNSLFQAVDAQVERLLTGLALKHKRDTPVGELPYADQRAVDIAQAVGSGAQLLLLDEPTAGMSQAQTAQFLERIADITLDKTILLIEHDMGVVFELAHRVAVFVDGRLVTCDVPEQVRKDPAVQRAYLGEWREEGESWPR
ncbi:MAG: ABC transporter ATP-binding protein [Burkholderiaceae bacterium]